MIQIPSALGSVQCVHETKLDQVFELGPKVLEFEKKCLKLNLEFRNPNHTGCNW